MNIQRFVQTALMVVLTVTLGYCLILYTHAEELPEFADEPTYQEDVSTPADSSVLVSAPDIVSRLDVMQESLARIADVVAPAVDDSVDSVVEDVEPTPEPVDYSAQLEQISSQLAALQESMSTATAETAGPAAFDKPFEDYTTTETLTLIAVAAVVLVAFLLIIKNFIL